MPHSPMQPTAPLEGSEIRVPEFAPHRWLKNGHSQTIVGRYMSGNRFVLNSQAQSVALSDGDRLCVLESIPPEWTRGKPAAVLIHGLSSSASAPYVVRFAKRLYDRGIRVARMNLRGAGEGFGMARRLYHAGLTEDVRTVTAWLADRAPGSPIAVAGFSLGASLTLKLAAEAAEHPIAGLDCVLAANPPVDLLAGVRCLQRAENFIYDWNFVRWLRAEAVRLHRRFPELGKPDVQDVRSLYEFDDRYTAPRNGFASAADYYQRSSAGPLVSGIRLPGLVVHAADDPFIPVEMFHELEFPANLEFELCKYGGHLGYVSQTPWRGDRRWLETRLTAWLCRRWGLGEP